MQSIKLIAVDSKIIEELAKREEGTSITTMRDALRAATTKADPVFAKRGASILVMERSQFIDILSALEVK